MFFNNEASGPRLPREYSQLYKTRLKWLLISSCLQSWATLPGDGSCDGAYELKRWVICSESTWYVLLVSVSTVSRTVPGMKEFVKHGTCLLNCVFYCLLWAAAVALPLEIYQICTDKITREYKSTISPSVVSNLAGRNRKKRGAFVFSVRALFES